MKSNKILSIAVISLIIINIILISFIWFNRPVRRGGRNPRAFHQQMLSRQLGFTSEQETLFRSMIQDFRPNKIAIEEKIFQNKRLLHESIFDSSIDADSLLSVISRLEKERESEILQHQRSIYNICNEHQKEKFKQLTRQTIQFRRRERGRGRRGM